MNPASVGHLEFGTTIPVSLYRLYDEEGVLLYVGVTSNLWQRLRAHAGRDWWNKVARTTVEWIATREEGLKAEARAIEDERPLYNIHPTPSYALPKPHRGRERLTRQDGTALKQLRERQLLSRTKAAEKIGCSRRTVEYLETGRTGASEIMLRRIAKAYGVTPDEIRKKATA